MQVELQKKLGSVQQNGSFSGLHLHQAAAYFFLVVHFCFSGPVLILVNGYVQTEMAGSPETKVILEALQAGRMSAKERQTAVERSIREEARRLRTGGMAGAQGVNINSWPAYLTFHKSC